jgi:hypothetical protein
VRLPLPGITIGALMLSDKTEDALNRATDPDRLLDGEDPDTTRLDNAQHWARIYRELLGFKRDVIGQADAGAAELPAEAAPEADTDLTILEAERQRLERRLEFWERRVKELAAS